MVRSMKKFRLTQCPYCGKKMNPVQSWYMKTQGEYICPKCGGISNVTLDPAVYLLACAAIVLSLAAFLITRMTGNIFSVSAVLWILLPVLLFTLLSSFLVRLKKPVLRKKDPKNGGRKGNARGSLYREGYTTQFTGVGGDSGAGAASGEGGSVPGIERTMQFPAPPVSSPSGISGDSQPASGPQSPLPREDTLWGSPSAAPGGREP